MGCEDMNGQSWVRGICPLKVRRITAMIRAVGAFTRKRSATTMLGGNQLKSFTALLQDPEPPVTSQSHHVSNHPFQHAGSTQAHCNSQGS